MFVRFNILFSSIGHVTISVARDHAPSSIVGLDIDKSLVNIAKKNIKYYMNSQPDDNTRFPRCGVASPVMDS